MYLVEPWKTLKLFILILSITQVSRGTYTDNTYRSSEKLGNTAKNQQETQDFFQRTGVGFGFNQISRRRVAVSGASGLHGSFTVIIQRGSEQGPW